MSLTEEQLDAIEAVKGKRRLLLKKASLKNKMTVKPEE